MDGGTRIFEIAKAGRKPHDLRGRTFGFLRAITRVEQLTDRQHRGAYWLVYCHECGGFACVMAAKLLHAGLVHCGCLRSEDDNTVPWPELARIEHRGRLYQPQPKRRRHRVLRLPA